MLDDLLQARLRLFWEAWHSTDPCEETLRDHFHDEWGIAVREVVDHCNTLHGIPAPLLVQDFLGAINMIDPVVWEGGFVCGVIRLDDGSPQSIPRWTWIKLNSNRGEGEWDSPAEALIALVQHYSGSASPQV